MRDEQISTHRINQSTGGAFPSSQLLVEVVSSLLSFSRFFPLPLLTDESTLFFPRSLVDSQPIGRNVNKPRRSRRE